MPAWEVALFVAVFGVGAVIVAGAIVCEKRDREFVRRTFRDRRVVPEVEFARHCSSTVSAATAERVRKVLASICDQPVNSALVHADAMLARELGYCLDSLAFPDLVCNLEKEFGIRVKLCEVTRKETVKDIFALSKINSPS
jgi:acyl carrier protein